MKADDVTAACFGTPSLTSTVSGFKNADSTGVNALSGPTLTIYDSGNNPVNTITQGGTLTMLFHRITVLQQIPTT